MPWSKRRTWLLVLIALAASSLVAGILLFGYSCSNPRDRVMVAIQNVPEGTVFACVAYELDGVWRKMNWCVWPIGWDPATYPWSYRDPHDPNVNWDEHPVRWKSGERFAVVTLTADAKWWITTFDAEDVKIEGASALTGGGRATFDLSKGRTAPLTGEAHSSLELGPP
jgi:hypothetical protein